MRDFEQVVKKWIREEEKKEQTFPDPPSATDLSEARLSEIVRAKYEGSRLLPKAKRDLLAEVEVADVLALIFAFLSDYLDEVEQRALEGEDLASDLGDELAKSPDPVDDEEKASAVDDLRDKVRKAGGRRSSPDTTTGEVQNNVAEQIQNVVSGDILSEEEVADFLESTSLPSDREEVVSQKVRQVDERYYDIMTKSGRSVSIGDASLESFNVVDSESGEQIEEVAGYNEAEISDDGTITLRSTSPGTPENASKTLQVVPQTKRKKRRAQKASSNISFDEDVANIEESFERESWACVMLQLVDRIKEAKAALDSGVRDMRKAVIRNARDVIGENYLDVVPQVENAVMGTLNSLKGALDTLPSSPETPVNRLGFFSSLSPRLNTSSAASICQQNKGNYCQVSSALSSLKGDLKAELESLNPSFGQNPIDNFADEHGYDPESVIDNLAVQLDALDDMLDKLDDTVSRLESAVCVWIQENRGGTPSLVGDTAQQFFEIAVEVAGISNDVPDVDVSGDMQEILDKLNRAGMDRAHQAVREGAIKDFIGMGEDEATYAGKTAKILGQKAEQTGSRAQALKLRNMEDAARSRANRVEVGQQIREGAQKRYHTYTGAQSARNIRNEGKSTIRQVEQEDG